MGHVHLNKMVGIQVEKKDQIGIILMKNGIM